MSLIIYSPLHAWMASYFHLLFGACVWSAILINVYKCCSNRKDRRPNPLEKAVADLQAQLAILKASQEGTARGTEIVLEKLKATLEDLPTGDNIQEIVDTIMDEIAELKAASIDTAELKVELKAEVVALKNASKLGALRIAEIKDEFHKVKASIEATDGTTLKEAVYTSLRAQAARLDDISKWVKNGEIHNPLGGRTSWAIRTHPNW